MLYERKISLLQQSSIYADHQVHAIHMRTFQAWDFYVRKEQHIVVAKTKHARKLRYEEFKPMVAWR